jgi:hypothetical protein
LPELVQPQDLGGPTPAERAREAAAAAGADWDGQALSAVTGPTGARVRVLVGDDGRPEGLLWADGDVASAIRLEELWNEAGELAPFSLLCSYPRSVLDDENGGIAEVSGVCAAHNLVAGPAWYADPPALGLGAAEALHGRRAGPALVAAVRQQAQLQRGEVAVADPARATFHAAPQQRPVNAIQQPAQAISPSTGHGHRRSRLRHAVDGGKTELVRSGKTLVARRRGLVHLYLETQVRQASGGQAQHGCSRHHARGRKDGQ